jgi:hypothetical protein
VRHHLEWRARAPALETLDAAAEANFARQDGEQFDPVLQGWDRNRPGVFRVEDDYFLEQRELPAARAQFVWHGRAWMVSLPEACGAGLLTVQGVDEPPPESRAGICPAAESARPVPDPAGVSAEVEAHAVVDSKES